MAEHWEHASGETHAMSIVYRIDKKIGITYVVWDGMVTKASDIAKGGVGRSVSASALEP